MKCAAYTYPVTAKSVTRVSVREHSKEPIRRSINASFLLGYARAHLDIMGARAGATTVAPVTFESGYANPVRAATHVSLASPSGSNNCYSKESVMTAQIVTFPARRETIADSLSLIQQYWLIQQYKADPAEHVALHATWHLLVCKLAKEQPELFKHVSLHPNLKEVLHDVRS